MTGSERAHAIRERRKAGATYMALAIEFNVSIGTVRNVVKEIVWKASPEASECQPR